MINLFQKKKKVTTYWTFKDVSPEKYILTMSLDVETDYIRNIFKENSKIATGIQMMPDVSELERFKIDNQYKNLIKVALKQNIMHINKTLAEQKIEISTYDVDDESFYTKLGDVMKAYLKISGYYVKR